MILITRPIKDALKTSYKLEKMGISTLISPILKVKFLKPSNLDLSSYDLAILTSKNALRKKISMPSKILVVGQTLEKLSLKYYPSSQVLSFGNAKDLSAHLSKIMRPDDKIIYLRGKDITKDLKKTFKTKCKIFDEQILYKTVVVKDYPLSVFDLVSSVAVYSLKTAKALNKIITNHNITIFALSHKIASAISVENSRIYVCEVPTEKSLFDLIRKHEK